MDTYPLHCIDDLFASLAGGKTFSTLALAHAYQQVSLKEGSRQYVTINTMKDLYRYNRLPFGVASVPSIFQRIMDTILQGLPGVCVYLHDILVTGETKDKHLRTWNKRSQDWRKQDSSYNAKSALSCSLLSNIWAIVYQLQDCTKQRRKFVPLWMLQFPKT